MTDANNEPHGDTPGPPPFPPGRSSHLSAPAAERSIPPFAVAAVVGVVALLIGGVGGYLLAGSSEQDLSAAGQVSYACGLVEKVREDHTTAEDWGDPFEDPAYSDVSAIATLFGGFVVPPGADAETFPDLGRKILYSVSRLEADEMNSVLELAHAECQNR